MARDCWRWGERDMRATGAGAPIGVCKDLMPQCWNAVECRWSFMQRDKKEPIGADWKVSRNGAGMQEVTKRRSQDWSSKPCAFAGGSSDESLR